MKAGVRSACARAHASSKITISRGWCLVSRHSIARSQAPSGADRRPDGDDFFLGKPLGCRPLTPTLAPCPPGAGGSHAQRGRVRGRPLLRRVLAPIAPDPQIGLFLVAPEALDRAQPAAIFADH